MTRTTSTPPNSAHASNGISKEKSAEPYVSEVLDEVVPPTEERIRSAAAGINWLFDNFDYDIQTFLFVGLKDGKRHQPVRCFTRTEKDKALASAVRFNNDGYDVYFMVNEGDGVKHEGKKVPRSHESVKNLSKLFLDTDNCPIDSVMDYLKSINLTPHFQIESSPGKYHLHFFLDKEEKTAKNITHWKAIQGIMHRLGDITIQNPTKALGMDNTMTDYAKVLRVPGFFHIEKKFEVRITDSNDIPPYTLEEMFAYTNAEDFLNYNKETHGSNLPSNVPSLTDTETIGAGGRFAALQSLALHLANSPAPFADKLGTFTLFARSRLDNADKIYVDENNLLTGKALDLFHSAVSKVEQEYQQQEAGSILTTATALEDEDSTHNKGPDPWHLPDEFYLSAPNGFGDVVRQVMDFSLYPCAALSFGVFLTGLSILKAKTHLTPKGSSPALYTLNVAISSFGKGDPFTLLQNMFVKNGMRSVIGNKIRSDRGIYTQLKAGDGHALFLLDEVAPLLKAIQKEDAATHHAYISEALLQLYSAGALKGVSFGKSATTGKKGEEEIIIDNPMVAICGFTVPSEFKKMFTLDSISKGLFQRFIPIIPEMRYVEENPNANKEGVVDSPLFRPYIEAQELDSEGNPVPSLQTGTRERMRYSKEAAAYSTQINADYRKRMISLAMEGEKDHFAALYGRLGEQIERVATVLSHGEIDLATLEWAHRFIDSRHQATLAQVGLGMFATAADKGIQREQLVVKALARYCKDYRVALASKTKFFKSVRRHFQDLREFEQVVTSLEAQGELEIVRNHKAQDDKAGRPGTYLKLQITFD